MICPFNFCIYESEVGYGTIVWFAFPQDMIKRDTILNLLITTFGSDGGRAESERGQLEERWWWT